MTVGTGLYVKGSAEAVELYKKAFGLELGYHVLNPDGSYFHSELMRGDAEMLSVVESSEAGESRNRSAQTGVVLDSEDEVKRAFELLSEEGTVEMPLGPLPWSPCAAVLTDKFGVWWYISAPQHRPAEDCDLFAESATPSP